MAKSNNSMGKNLLYVVVGVLAFKALTGPQWQPAPNPFPDHPEIPPAPAQTGGQNWQQWVGMVVSLYGTAASLWEPGGPFYNEPVPEPTQDPDFWAAYTNISWP